jgi:Fur family transcriptional regulator, iron response regulator
VQFRAYTSAMKSGIASTQLGDAPLVERMQRRGVRVTEQRLRVARVLLSAPQHLTAEQIAEAVRGGGLHISKATIYNTLNLFVERGLIRQLAVGMEQTWFDSNVESHYHFQDEISGALTDLPTPDVEFARLPAPPPGMEVAGIDLVIRLRRRL